MGDLQDYFSGKTTADKVKKAEMIAQANALRADKKKPKPKPKKKKSVKKSVSDDFWGS
jgi:hypothetical protein